VFEVGDPFSDTKQLLLALLEMQVDGIAKDCGFEEFDEIGYPFAFLIVLIRQSIQDNRAVNIHIFTNRIVLQCSFSIDDRISNHSLLLLDLLPEEPCIDIQVLEGGFDAFVEF
jgi:hypothetical protein